MIKAAQSSFYNNAAIVVWFQTSFHLLAAAEGDDMYKTFLFLDTYRSSRFLIVDLKVGHGFDDGHNGLDCVAVDNCSVLLTLIFWVSILMDNPEKNREQREGGEEQEKKRLVCYLRWNYNVTITHTDVITDYTLQRIK